MFPCTAVMYWLGTQGILDLRETRSAARRGAAFSLKAFHDELLSSRIDSGAAHRAADDGVASMRENASLVLALAASLVAATSLPRRARRDAGPSNDLLIVGYDREPDTMNRYATHILEDIQSCVDRRARHQRRAR